MNIIILLLVIIGSILIVWAIFTFIVNTNPGPNDEMGKSIMFNTWWSIGSLFLSIAYGLQSEIEWYWGVLTFICLLIATPLVVQPYLNLILRLVNWRGINDALISENKELKPVDMTEMLRVLIGLFLCGYVSIDSFFTDSVLGYYRDGFFRIYRSEEPISFWIYRSLCMGAALACIWGVIWLLTTDRYRPDD